MTPVKKIILCLLVITPSIMFAQLGLKAGLNFANITNANSINATSRTGFHAGIFFAGSSKSILSSRSELLFSRQGYNFENNSNTGTVNLDYILFPQLLAINITPLFQIQAGGQVAYLINAKLDSTSTGSNSADQVIKLYNRLDFGLAGGVEVHPLKSVVVGARINVSLGRLYKEPEPGQQYSFIPDIDAKNNLFQLFAGIKFGGD